MDIDQTLRDLAREIVSQHAEQLYNYIYAELLEQARNQQITEERILQELEPTVRREVATTARRVTEFTTARVQQDKRDFLKKNDEIIRALRKIRIVVERIPEKRRRGYYDKKWTAKDIYTFIEEHVSIDMPYDLTYLKSPANRLGHTMKRAIETYDIEIGWSVAGTYANKGQYKLKPPT